MQRDTRRQWAKNRVGPYRVLRRLRGTTTAEEVGRVYTAVHRATGRPALLIAPVGPGQWNPESEWRLRVRTATAPGPFLAMEVEHAPQGKEPLVSELADGMEVLMLALEGVERHPEAAAHLSALPLPPRRHGSSRRGQWAALVLAGMVLAALCLPRVWRTDAQPAQEHEGALSTATAEQALEAPEAMPVGTLTARAPWQAVSLNMPKSAFRGQKVAPCESGFEVEIVLQDGSRACWIQVVSTGAKCKSRGYEWKGNCYLPSYPPQREPSSTMPPRAHPVPAQQSR